jgi:hypothetical protein
VLAAQVTIACDNALMEPHTHTAGYLFADEEHARRFAAATPLLVSILPDTTSVFWQPIPFSITAA